MDFQDWFDVVGYSILTITIGFLVYRLSRNKANLENIAKLYMEKLIDYKILQDTLEKTYEEKMALEAEKSDGFVKFLSDSRDWAFQYIENVQASLNDFDEKVQPTLEWADKYGGVNGETVYTNALNKISEAYRELKEILPKNDETPNN
jgi:hypothetical protein